MSETPQMGALQELLGAISSANQAFQQNIAIPSKEAFARAIDNPLFRALDESEALTGPGGMGLDELLMMTADVVGPGDDALRILKQLSGTALPRTGMKLAFSESPTGGSFTLEDPIREILGEAGERLGTTGGGFATGRFVPEEEAGEQLLEILVRGAGEDQSGRIINEGIQELMELVGAPSVRGTTPLSEQGAASILRGLSKGQTVPAPGIPSAVPGAAVRQSLDIDDIVDLAIESLQSPSGVPSAFQESPLAIQEALRRRSLGVQTPSAVDDFLNMVRRTTTKSPSGGVKEFK
jgi:hypothetical protein